MQTWLFNALLSCFLWPRNTKDQFERTQQVFVHCTADFTRWPPLLIAFDVFLNHYRNTSKKNIAFELFLLLCCVFLANQMHIWTYFLVWVSSWHICSDIVIVWGFFHQKKNENYQYWQKDVFGHYLEFYQILFDQPQLNSQQDVEQGGVFKTFSIQSKHFSRK